MQEIIPVSLEGELQSSYIDYAMSVIISRAIPDARDGLKPVQRRVLYAMYSIKNFHDQPTKKSARVVGEVIGKFHPHGDTAIYDALARLAQDFSMNHLLVEGQGNFGSIDGDPPAAMRYTEVRLQKLSEQILDDIEKNTVDFVPNFDDTEKEPVVLPAKVPNLLINGATGIAVGVATSIPPHNLAEICDAIMLRIDKKESTIEDMLNVIKGPDFPTGGIAVMSQNAYNGYKFGRGQLTIKAKADINEAQKKVIIKEIPYNVNKSNLIQTMAELARDKKIVGLRDIRDESDKNGIRIVIDYKEEGSGEQILNMLYKHTQLQVTFPLINLAIIGKSLKSLNILQLIDTFLTHRREVVLRRSKYELEVAMARLHIVEGLLIAIEHIDQIIATIKGSSEVEEARKKLMEGYSLTEKQANAILDMKLSRLTRLENNSLAQEKKELETKVAYYQKVIRTPEEIDRIIREETADIKKKFGRQRRTEILHAEEDVIITDEDTISDEKITIIFTNSGYVKKLSLAAYREQARGGRGIISINLKEGDYTRQILTCNNKDYLICITNAGRVYWLKAYNVPEGGRYSEGKAIVNLLNIKDEKVLSIINIKDFQNADIVFLTAKGLIKKTKAMLFSKPRSNGVRAITLNQGDEIVDVIIQRAEKYFTIATKNGKSIKFEGTDVREIGRSGMGVRGIRLSGNDVAENIIATGDNGSLLTITEKGYGKITDVNEYRLQGRGGGGVKNIKVSDKTGPVAKCIFISNQTKVILINSLGVSITFPISMIRVTGRVASGVRLMKLEAGAKVVDAIPLTEEPS
ncbi:MAG: DNA gyrase subunit A [Candidatus Micrarchaeota archaeon]|nr:DNA gyrase subunit A [Candidatus Micrarchaeota archaeon]